MTLKTTIFHSEVYMIGHKIKMAMTDKSVTTERLAELLGVSRQTVHRYRTSKDLKWSTITRICEALDIDVTDLVRY